MLEYTYLQNIIRTIRKNVAAYTFSTFNQKAFTLAEVLVVIGIIGVIATLTLPNLNNSTGDIETVSKVKKFYAELNNAFERAELKYGSCDDWCSDINIAGQFDICQNSHLEKILDFMKTSKICNSVNECTIDFKETSFRTMSKAAILADGMTIGFNGFGEIVVVVDVDGINKGPQLEGYDIFSFRYNHEQGIYFHNCGDHVHKFDIPGYDSQCAAKWILDVGNMEYLKTKDGTTCPNETKLTFNGNHTCK